MAGCAVQTPPLVDATLSGFEDKADQAQTAPDWWTVLGDTQLNTLVSTALSANFSLKAAAARLGEAHANEDVSLWSLLPKANADLRPAYEKTMKYQQDNAYFPTVLPPAQGTSNNTFNVSWELPLFGKAAATANLQIAQVRQAHWQLEAAKLSVAADVVRIYAQLQGVRAAQAQLKVRQSELDVLQHSEQVLKAAGSSTQSNVEQLQDQLLQLHEQVRAYESQEAQLQAKLSTLAGQPDVTVLTKPIDFEALRAPVVKEVRADALRQRPDVRVTEAAVTAAAAQLGIAKANLWPQFTLGGDINLMGGHLDSFGLTQGSASTITATAGLHLPLLDWFALNDQAKVKSNDLDAAVFDYRQAVLAAWEEARTDYATLVEAQDKERFARDAVRLAEVEVSRQEKLLKAAASTRMDVAKAVMTLEDRRTTALNEQSNALQAWAKLVKATFIQHQIDYEPQWQKTPPPMPHVGELG